MLPKCARSKFPDSLRFTEPLIIYSSNGMVVINENCQHSQHSPLMDMNRQQKKAYSGSSPIVPVEQTSHPQNIGYGALNSSHHSYSPGHNQNLNTSTTIKNNSMPTSTLV